MSKEYLCIVINCSLKDFVHLISLSLSRFGPREGRHGRDRRALYTQVKTGEWSECVCVYVCKSCAVLMLCEALRCYCDVSLSDISFLFLSVDLDPGKVGMGGIEGPSAHRWKQVSGVSGCAYMCVSAVLCRCCARRCDATLMLAYLSSHFSFSQ